MTVQFVLSRTGNGRYKFRLLGENRALVDSINLYKNKLEATTAIQDLIRQVSTDAGCQRLVTPTGQHYFEIAGPRGERVARSGPYSSVAEMEDDILAVRGITADTPVKDRTKHRRHGAARPSRLRPVLGCAGLLAILGLAGLALQPRPTQLRIPGDYAPTPARFTVIACDGRSGQTLDSSPFIALSNTQGFFEWEGTRAPLRSEVPRSLVASQSRHGTVVLLQRVGTKPRWDYYVDETHGYRNLAGHTSRFLPLHLGVLTWRAFGLLALVPDLIAEIAGHRCNLAMLIVDNATEDALVLEVVDSGSVVLEPRSHIAVFVRAGTRELRVGHQETGAFLEGHRIEIVRSDAVQYRIYNVGNANSYTVQTVEER